MGYRHLQTTAVVALAAAVVLMMPRAPAIASQSRPCWAVRRCLATSTWRNRRRRGAADKAARGKQKVANHWVGAR